MKAFNSIPLVLATILTKKLELDITTNSILIMALQELFVLDFGSRNITIDLDYYLITRVLGGLSLIAAILGIIYLSYIARGIQKAYMEFKTMKIEHVDRISNYIQNNPEFFSEIKMIQNGREDMFYQRAVSGKANEWYAEYYIEMLNLDEWIEINDTEFEISGRLKFHYYVKPYQTTAKEKTSVTNTCNFVLNMCTFQLNTRDTNTLNKYLEHMHFNNSTKKYKVQINYNYLGDESSTTITRNIYSFSGKQQKIIANSIMNTFFSPHKDYIFNICKSINDNAEKIIMEGNIPRASFILHGPPGSGKSSLPQRLSFALNRSIYELNLNNIKDENDLKEILNNYTSSCIFVIDEFDLVLDTLIEREQQKRDFLKMSCEYDQIKMSNAFIMKKKLLKGDSSVTNITDTDFNLSPKTLTISSLLNIFQGAIPRIGLIIFATTMNLQRIIDKCPALVRPGRFTPIEMSYPTQTEVDQLTEHYYSTKLEYQIPAEHNVSMSLVSELAINSNNYIEFEQRLKAAFEKTCFSSRFT